MLVGTMRTTFVGKKSELNVWIRIASENHAISLNSAFKVKPGVKLPMTIRKKIIATMPLHINVIRSVGDDGKISVVLSPDCPIMKEWVQKAS